MALGELLESYLLNETTHAAKPTSVVNHPAITHVDSMVEVRSSANDQSASRQQLFGVHGGCNAIELPGSFFSACVHESSEGAVISQWNFREADPRRPYTSLTDTRLGEARAEERQSGELDRRSVPQQHLLRRPDCSPRAQGNGSLGVLGAAPRRNAFQGAAVSGRMAEHHRD